MATFDPIPCIMNYELLCTIMNYYALLCIVRIIMNYASTLGKVLGKNKGVENQGTKSYASISYKMNILARGSHQGSNGQDITC